MKAFPKQLWKMPLLALGYVVLLVVVNGVMPLDFANTSRLSAEEVKSTGLILLACSFVLAGLVSVLVYRLRLSGLKLYLAVLTVAWGLETFMTQMETGIFIKAFPLLNTAELFKLFARDFILLAAFVPLAILVQGGWRKKEGDEKAQALAPGWQGKAALLCGLYLGLYFLFGLFPWSFIEVREFYAAWNRQSNQSLLALIQVFRGGLWLLCALPIFFFDRGPKRQTVLFLVVLYAVFPTFQLFFPNALMPKGVRMAHFVEVFSEMAIFGLLAGWLLVDPHVPARRRYAFRDPTDPERGPELA